MRLETTFLHSRFGRRVFTLFVGCALLPVLLLAMVSYVSVRKNLRSQSEQRLKELSKTTAMGIWERLNFLDTQLQIVASRLRTGPVVELPSPGSLLGHDLAGRFQSLSLVGETGDSMSLHGPALELAALEAGEAAHLDSGKPLLRFLEGIDGRAQPIIGRRVAFQDAGTGTLWGKVQPQYLWWGATLENTLPVSTELHVMGLADQQPLFGSLEEATESLVGLLSDSARASKGTFSWRKGGVDFQSHHRIVNLRAVFHYPGIGVVLSESEELTLAPVEDFEKTFPAILVISLCVVLLLSIHQIRRSVRPLEKLQDGTRKIAAGDLDAQVEIESGDEFAELAGSFNAMAHSLGQQFKTLSTLSELQQAVLSELDTERIVMTVLTQFSRLLECQEVSVTLVESDRPGSGQVYSCPRGPNRSPWLEFVELSAADLSRLESIPDWLVVDCAPEFPSYCLPWPGRRIGVLVTFPAVVHGTLAAVVVAGFESAPALEESDLIRARQLTDQVAVALANARLIQELDNLNWGTLTALARTIDVRSHWTMGHTERVTNLAQQIGRELGLPKERLDALHRGGLLHDIGKIGVPSEIVDKPGKLSAGEMEIVRRHVELGVRIIEPVPGLADALPVVLHHHEWFNGEGYPAGLAGEEICLEARILAVADVYDALQSNRPYRAALTASEVHDYLRQQSGSQFDPLVVETLFGLLASERLISEAPVTVQRG